MASNREQRQEDVRFLVMRLLEENPSITTREIARLVGISNGSAHYCVTALISKGFVELRNLARYGKKTDYFYELTPQGIKIKTGLALKFLERKRKDYEFLKSEIAGLEAELSSEGNNILARDGSSNGN